MTEMHSQAPRTAPEKHQPMWRSLSEYANTTQFRSWLHREFPEQASEWAGDESSRREFLKLMGASLAMAGAAGCARRPEEEIVPAVEIPEQAPGGPPQLYASSMPMSGGSLGILVESRDGRPTKIEGNSQHPASLGATGIFAQAAVLGLYDPDRSQVVRKQEQISSRDALFSELTLHRERLRSQQGRGLRILSPPILSPTLNRQRKDLLEEFPEAGWHQHEPINDDTVRSGSQMAFGQPVLPIYHFDRADIVLSLDADFLGVGPGRVRYARDFAGRRAAATQAGQPEMSRLYVVESTPSLTGASADHRLRLMPEEMLLFVRKVASRLGIDAGGSAATAMSSDVPGKWWEALVADLTHKSRNPLVLAGPQQPAEVHALVHVINHRLGSAGQTVGYVERSDGSTADSVASLAALVDDMVAGEVDSLLILNSNPVFNAPADLKFASAMKNVPFLLHYGLEFDETAEHCQWHVPAAHFLETWSDTRAYDGTISPVQPLIAPLYAGHGLHQLLNVLLGRPDQSDYATVRAYWRKQHGEDGFEAYWRQAVHDGVFPETAFSEAEVTLRDNAVSDLPAHSDRSSADKDSRVTVLFRPHPGVWDGRFANNGWLQELPQPFTGLTWGNAAMISPSTAGQYGLSDGDVVELESESRRVTIPVVAVPGQAENVITVHMGCGRRRSGRVGTGTGTDVYPLRTTGEYRTAKVRLTKTAQHEELPRTQHHFLMEGRDLIRRGTLAAYTSDPAHPSFMHSTNEESDLTSLYPDEHPQGEYQWGMSIDLTACIGCSACTIACQAENNIPVVGPQEVARGREMHWLRVDTYFAGTPENPAIHHQPVPCMHCEHAPCEVVCPVAATTHSDEGLNEMTYNRCIGTRYCSNNCPYKVRRFNFFDYQQQTRDTPVLQLLQNPDVSVRTRGVMEKCTYCVQRINTARIQSEMQGRPIGDGELVTACQSVCPTQAIVFGDISNPDSAVARRKAHALNYGLLEELNTRPRTTYLAELRNPHRLLSEEEA